MSQQKRRFVAVLVCVCFVAIGASVVSSQIPPDLIGMWNYSSLTAIKDGRPFGTVHFQPGQWTMKLNADGRFFEKGPLKSKSSDSDGATGKYEVHKHEFDMRPDRGSHELKYNFKLEEGGKVLVLTDKDKGTIIKADRE